MVHDYFFKYLNVLIRPLKFEDIETLRIWRNDLTNSRFLHSTDYITKEMQENWYYEYESENGIMYFAIEEIELFNRVVGALALYDINDHKCEIGKILVGDKLAHGKHVGFNAMYATMTIAFMYLDIYQVNLSVHPDNLPAMSIYKKLGFSIVGEHDWDYGTEYEMQINVNDFKRRMIKDEFR